MCRTLSTTYRATLQSCQSAPQPTEPHCSPANHLHNPPSLIATRQNLSTTHRASLQSYPTAPQPTVASRNTATCCPVLIHLPTAAQRPSPAFTKPLSVAQNVSSALTSLPTALQRPFADLMRHFAALQRPFADLTRHFAVLQRPFADLTRHFAAFLYDFTPSGTTFCFHVNTFLL